MGRFDRDHKIVIDELTRDEALTIYAFLIGVPREELYEPSDTAHFSGKARAFWPANVKLRPMEEA